MSRLRFVAAASVLSFAAAVLWLNLREKDYYEGGTLAPPPPGRVLPDEGTLRGIVPETVSHPCPAGGPCVHPLEILEHHRVLALRDHDGWYRLLWAGDEIYYFEDPAFFAACLRNSTARDPAGTWRIRARAHGPTGSGNPACLLEPSEFTLEYRLEVSPDPALPDPGEGPVPRTVEWFGFFPARRHLPALLHFRWRLAIPSAPPAFRCSCGKK